MKYTFPAAFLANTFAVTGLIVLLGLTGNLVAAADFDIVHTATVALPHSFSPNAPSIILNPAAPISTSAILGSVLLLLPLGLLSLLLRTQLARLESVLALVLVCRRCAEWIAGIHVSEMEWAGEQRQAALLLLLQTALFVLTAICLVAGLPYVMPVLLFWVTFLLWLSLRFLLKRAVITSVAAEKLGGKYDLTRLQTDTAMFAPKNRAERPAYWKFYSGEILESPKAAVLGHATPPDRTKYPSAHNYYLVLGLAVTVLFIVLLDSSFKVGMRQPYPGILTFFLWGLLLTQLFQGPAPSMKERQG